MLGWVETEPEKMMEIEFSLHFNKEAGAGKMSLHKRHELVGRNVVCKDGQGKTLNENPQNLDPSSTGILERKRKFELNLMRETRKRFRKHDVRGCKESLFCQGCCLFSLLLPASTYSFM